jgi:hypothetical protein
MPAPSVLAFDASLDLGAIVERMRELPPHPDVPGALTRLGDAGAPAAGCAAAFVARPDTVLSPLGERPDIAGADLDEVADGILATAG